MITRLGSGLACGDDGYRVGQQAAEQAMAHIGGLELKLVLVFASPMYDLSQTLQGVRQVTSTAPLMGCSSAGEFTDRSATSGAVAVALIGSDTINVRLGVGRDFTQDLPGAVTHALAGFLGNSETALRAGYLGRTLFLMTDGLTGMKRTAELQETKERAEQPTTPRVNFSPICPMSYAPPAWHSRLCQTWRTEGHHGVFRNVVHFL